MKWLNAFIGVSLPMSKPRRAVPKTTASRTAADWASERDPERTQDRALSDISLRWRHALPVHMRPVELFAQYPRIANRLALCWSDPELTQRVLDDLIVDRRGGRRGFPQAVAAELLMVRELHEERYSAPDRHEVWSALNCATTDR